MFRAVCVSFTVQMICWYSEVPCPWDRRSLLGPGHRSAQPAADRSSVYVWVRPGEKLN